MRLDDLFRVTDDFTMPGGEVVPLRVLSDIELKIRADAAQDAAVEVLGKLEDKSGEFYKRNVKPIVEADVDALIAFLVTARAPDIERDVYASIQPSIIAVPDGAEQDEMEDIEIERREEEIRIDEERFSAIKARLESYKKSIESLEVDELRKRAELSVRVPFTMEARRRAHILWTVHLASDKKYTVEQLENMDPKVVLAMYTRYQEIDQVDPFGLPLQS